LFLKKGVERQRRKKGKSRMKRREQASRRINLKCYPTSTIGIFSISLSLILAICSNHSSRLEKDCRWSNENTTTNPLPNLNCLSEKEQTKRAGEREGGRERGRE
jgi:hypothetical protein